MVSHLNSFQYVDMDGEFTETPCQTFEVIPPTATEDVSAILKVTRVLPRMDSLKFTRDVVEEEGQRNVRHARAGRPPFRVNNNGFNAVEDANSDYDLDNCIFPTINNGLSNWKTKDIIPISFSKE